MIILISILSVKLELGKRLDTLIFLGRIEFLRNCLPEEKTMTMMAVAGGGDGPTIMKKGSADTLSENNVIEGAHNFPV